MIKRKALEIINRVEKRKAIGFIYNLPFDSEKAIMEKMKKEQHLLLNGKNAYQWLFLKNRLQEIFENKNIDVDMLPNLLGSKMVVINNADMLTESYGKIFAEFSRNKIPMLLLLRAGNRMERIRKFENYNSILTIEQNYDDL